MINNIFTNDHLNFVDLSLSRIRIFLEKIGNPQDKIKNIIHVAGTNGKGSTCAFLRSILEGHGYSVNVFTSPHLVYYNERFRLSGELISDSYLEEIKSKLQYIEGYKNLTIFELTMVIGFVAFFEKSADFCIIEVGVGGRLDASNVVKNTLLSIISTIDFDHQNFLGNTLEQITYEKSGIIKENSKVITDYQKNKILKIIKKQSLRLNSELIAGGIDYSINFQGKYPILFYNNKKIILSKIGLQGNHQYYNASLAIITCINILQDKFNYNELPSMLNNTSWLGRLQKVDSLYNIKFQKSEVYLDGAHNLSGCRVLCDFIKNRYKSDSNIHIFIGMLVKKDLDGFFNIITSNLKDFNIIIYPIEIKDHVSYSVSDILLIAKTYNLKSIEFDSIKYTLQKIDKDLKENAIFICGSLYLLGKILSDNCIDK